MSRVRVWTDEEIGWLIDHPHLSARAAGEELGRGMQSVQHMRNKLRLGWEPIKEHWTESEKDYIRATPNLTARQVAENLGRSRHGVEHVRSALAATEGLRFGDKGGRKNPHEIGKRRLLAKTCPACGLLLEASWFGFNKKQWKTKCQRCQPAQKPRERKKDDSAKRTYDRLQALTLEHATRHGQPWLESDHTTLADPDMTLLTKALTLGRTYAATAEACSRNGYASQIGKGDPIKGQWVIDNPNAPAIPQAA